MNTRIEVPGASGRIYDYVLLPDDVSPPPQAANLILAERKRGQWRLLHVGHTDYLPRNEWRTLRDQIRLETPRAQLLFRLNVARGVRLAEAEDISRLHLTADAEAA